ncbi:hypothetical protein J1TS1_34790 [Shouchella clausii]|uniref:replication initiation protein n=1 Tax=Shouchella clausii TaxID=79880 RepID=UPI001B135CD7|nr:replication initiation protein [Shouchella clausii]GIN09334.1 hypothetical protein J1TS1_34790 [Shouchella clausii]
MDEQLLILSMEETVKKANIIEMPQDLTLQEKRIIWVLASFINKKDTSVRQQQIKIEDLAKLIGIDIAENSYYKVVKDTIEGLISKKVTFNKGNERTVLAWLSSATYDKGTGMVELKFSEMLRPYLLQLNHQLRIISRTPTLIQEIKSFLDSFGEKNDFILRPFLGTNREWAVQCFLTHIDEAKRVACGKIAVRKLAFMSGGKSETEKTNF